MKLKQLLATSLVLLTIGACSNDEFVDSGTPAPPKVFTGDEAYMRVKLADVGSTGGRATSGDPEFEYGTAAEHDVLTADFYFYDENKVFVAGGNAWNGGTANEGDPAGNIEFEGETIVVVKGLTN